MCFKNFSTKEILLEFSDNSTWYLGQLEHKTSKVLLPLNQINSIAIMSLDYVKVQKEKKQKGREREEEGKHIKIVSVQLFSHVHLSATQWTTACQSYIRKII